MKYFKNLALLALLVLIGLNIQAQKKELSFDDILKWNRITEKEISNNGNYVVYKLEPWKGDPILKVTQKDGTEILSEIGGESATVTQDSKYMVSKIKPLEENVRQLKLKETKKEDLPLDKLLIFNLESKKKDVIDNLKSFKVPSEWSGWIAFQTKTDFEKDTTKGAKEPKKESQKNGFTLNVANLGGETIQFPYVTKYIFAEEKPMLAFVSTGDDQEFKAGVYQYNLSTKSITPVMIGEAEYKQLSFSDDASLLAFLSDSTSIDEEDAFSLYLWNGTLAEIVNNQNSVLKTGWEVSKNGRISFSKSNKRIFFGTAPVSPKRDTTKLDEEIPVVDVWHWNEPVLHTQQLNSKDEDLKKSYLAVYHIDQQKAVQLESKDFTGILKINKGDADRLVAWSNLPYSVQIMWEGYPYHNDFYLVDINTGKATKIKEDCRATPNVSTNGKYLYWYYAVDSSWYTYNLKAGKEYRVTSPDLVQCADELNDVPNLPYNYGTPGWLENDEAFLVYDRFDIWKIDPENKKQPLNLTKTGKQENISYRLVDYDRNNKDYEGLNLGKTYHVKGHNEITREDGYYTLNLKKPAKPNELFLGKHMLNTPIKAKNSDVYVYTKEDFQQFPDLQITEGFKKSKQISSANPQQEEFKWGTIELYSWTSLDGRKLQGLLAKPANFDPNKKYPMIVNFYEKSSHELYEHKIPEAHRSTVDYHYYTSNGYIVFNPDVYYKTGYPGEDAFNCVMPGVTQLISEGFVDEKSIAAQGHSWGGYQVAYLATRTNLFAAIESGAPVVNMFSAYGGIRLWSGRNRSFQYEHTQSRIGKSIWEAPLRYLENSPLFTADKIQTPLLIMHNDLDGAVPVSQGVEFFVALRRMGKPAWLLNYNEGDHWPTLVRDKYDFQVRLAQFFDHFLKGESMPKWMKEGIPAVDKGFELGYELED